MRAPPPPSVSCSAPLTPTSITVRGYNDIRGPRAPNKIVNMDVKCQRFHHYCKFTRICVLGIYYWICYHHKITGLDIM